MVDERSSGDFFKLHPVVWTNGDSRSASESIIEAFPIEGFSAYEGSVDVEYDEHGGRVWLIISKIQKKSAAGSCGLWEKIRKSY
jgi:hypothetical protein|tara:strand:+ start:2485 stop:2736 length:252 start_codon:yes stop_codon:yes gene_type:complete